MKILIATGIYPPKVGGPAQYAANLERIWKSEGHKVAVVTYGIENYLPIGVRHLFFLVKMLFRLPGAQFCLALDTYSTGIPAMIACKILNVPLIVRVGGDFLWESYLNRTKEKIMLSDFYNQERKFSFKEKMIFWFSKRLFRNSSAVVFNTRWQANIFARPYALNMEDIYTIENFYGEKKESIAPTRKNFLWHVRDTFLKNGDVIKSSFAKVKEPHPDIELESGVISYEELAAKMQSCYAVLLPSVSDVSPNYIIDALSFSKPCIMTRDTGLREKLDGFVIFVNPLDEDEIADAISQLLEPDFYKERVERIKRFTFSHSWNEIADEFMSIHEKISYNLT